MMNLSQIAHEERMIPDAPILATHAIDINASVERVWQIATDVKKWPQWHDELKNAEIDGLFVQGTHFSFGGLVKHHLTLSTIKQFDLVMYFGTLLGYAGVTKWEFTPLTSQTEREPLRIVFSTRTAASDRLFWLRQTALWLNLPVNQ